MDEREQIPFDISSFRVLQFDTRDPRSLARACDQLNTEICSPSNAVGTNGGCSQPSLGAEDLTRELRLS